MLITKEGTVQLPTPKLSEIEIKGIAAIKQFVLWVIEDAISNSELGATRDCVSIMRVAISLATTGFVLDGWLAVSAGVELMAETQWQLDVTNDPKKIAILDKYRKAYDSFRAGRIDDILDMLKEELPMRQPPQRQETIAMGSLSRDPIIKL